MKVYKSIPIEDLPFGEKIVNVNNGEERHFDRNEYLDAIRKSSDFAKKHGRVGKVYGSQWVNWTKPVEEPGFYQDIPELIHRQFMNNEDYRYKIEGYNQLQKLIDTLQNSPDSRRMLVTAWNPPEMDECALPCCHYGFQCYTSEISVEDRIRFYADNVGQTYDEFKTNWDTDEQWTKDLDLHNIPKRRLSLKFTIRSIDEFLGCPFDIASYSILTHMLCKQLNMIPDELIMTSGDSHIYLNHIDQVKLQLSREPYPNLPQLILKGEIGKSIFDYKYEDFEIVGYEHHPAIKAPIAV